MIPLKDLRKTIFSNLYFVRKSVYCLNVFKIKLCEINGIGVDKYGTKYWYKDGFLHREDGPAIEYPDGSKEWYKNGLLHREVGPAIEFTNGSKLWYFNNQRHREDGPAIERASGEKEWWLNGDFIKKYRPEESYEMERIQIENLGCEP